MDERFISFAALLRATSGAASPEPATPADPPAAALLGEPFFEELARVRVAALEAFERASARVLGDLAREVLGRELALAPHDIDALVERARAEFAAHEPVTLVLSPRDAARVRASVPVRADPDLRPGDAVVEVTDGAFESFAELRVRAVVVRALREAV